MSLKLNSSGGGSITLQEPSTASNRTLTLPDNTGNLISSADSGTVSQAMLASGVAGNGPAFSAWQNAGQSLSATTWTALACQAEEFDTANCYSTSTYAFTPNVAGYYYLAGGFQVATTQTTLLCQIYKNGSSYKTLIWNPTTPGAWGSCLAYLNGTTDYVQMYVYSGVTQNTAANQVTTYFQGFLARAA